MNDALSQQGSRAPGGPFGLEARAPSRRNDPHFRNWWATYLRMGCSPGAAVALSRMNSAVDVRDILPAIHVPSLLIHRTGDRSVPVEQGRHLAQHIAGSRFIELPGDDHLPFVGDQDSILNAIERFVAELRETPLPIRVLATLLYMRTSALDEKADREIDWHSGRRFAQMRDALVATFDGPARAIRCACRLVDLSRNLGIPAGAGVHAGECDLHQDTLTGDAVAIGAMLADAARPGEVVVSNTVVSLVPGSGLHFDLRGHSSLGNHGEWPMYVVR